MHIDLLILLFSNLSLLETEYPDKIEAIDEMKSVIEFVIQLRRKNEIIHLFKRDKKIHKDNQKIILSYVADILREVQLD